MWQRKPHYHWMLDSVQTAGLPLSDMAIAHFQKQGISQKKRCNTNSEEEINTTISEKVEVAIKASNTDPKKQMRVT